MIAPVQRKPSVKIAGYLEKRGKMRVVCRWKQWWFVLEGRLLLYYKSQLEYINLSPCRGSLNMGLASSVKPGKGLELQVVTRSQTVILRAANRADHEQWLQAMLDAMTVQGSTNTFSSYPVLHFRYSNDVPFDRQDSLVNRIKHFGGRSYTLPVTSNENGHLNGEEMSNNNNSTNNWENMANTESQEYMLKKKISQSSERLNTETKSSHLERNPVRISLRRSKIGLSDTFIPEKFQKENRLSDLSEQTSLSLNDLRKSFTCSNKDISKHDYVEIDYGFEKENEHSPDKENPKKVNSQHKHVTDTSSKNEEQNHKGVEEIMEASVQTMKNISQQISFNRDNTYRSVKKNVSKSDQQDKKPLTPSISLHKDKYYFGLCQSKDIRSDTDLSVKKMSRPLSASCGEIQKVSVYSESKLVEPAINSALVYDKKQISTGINKQNVSKVLSHISEKPGTKSRSNSLLCKGKEVEKGFERRGTLKKRSLSFLRRVWRKKENKQEEQDYETVDYETIPHVIHVIDVAPPPPPSSKVEPKKPSPVEIGMTGVSQIENAPEEPSPDYDTSLIEEIEKPPELPPRQKERPPSPWHDIPKNNAPIVPPDDEVPPALPAKTMIHRSVARRHNDDMYTLKHHHEWTLKQDHTLCYQSETTVKVNDVKKLTDIDTLLAELSEVNFLATNEINKPCTWKTTCSVMANHNNNNNIMEDSKNPDYDIPRPHASLLTTLRSQNLQSEAIPPTNFFCTVSHNERDSVGTTISRFSSEIDLEITPDSLECNIPLSMSGQANGADFVWIPPTLHTTTSPVGAFQRHHYFFGDNRQYEDSLNT